MAIFSTAKRMSGSTTRIWCFILPLMFAPSGSYPEELLDTNIASDYGKLRELFRIEGQEVQNLAVLNELITNGQIAAQLTRQFSFEKEFERDDLVSILFYLGIVTIKEAHCPVLSLNRLILSSPNSTSNTFSTLFFNEPTYKPMI